LLDGTQSGLRDSILTIDAREVRDAVGHLTCRHNRAAERCC
jgi:hypothetical protein